MKPVTFSSQNSLVENLYPPQSDIFWGLRYVETLPFQPFPDFAQSVFQGQATPFPLSPQSVPYPGFQFRPLPFGFEYNIFQRRAAPPPPNQQSPLPPFPRLYSNPEPANRPLLSVPPQPVHSTASPALLSTPPEFAWQPPIKPQFLPSDQPASLTPEFIEIEELVSELNVLRGKSGSLNIFRDDLRATRDFANTLLYMIDQGKTLDPSALSRFFEEAATLDRVFEMIESKGDKISTYSSSFMQKSVSTKGLSKLIQRMKTAKKNGSYQDFKDKEILLRSKLTPKE